MNHLARIQREVSRTASPRVRGRGMALLRGLLILVLSATWVVADEPVNPDLEPVAASAQHEPRSGKPSGLLVQGGILMIPLVICSFVVFVFIFERTIALRRGRIVPGPFVRKFLEQVAAGELGPQEAVRLCRENGSPMAEIFAAGAMKWDRTSVEVEQAMIDAGERVIGRLRRHLRVFHGIYTIAPMFGLLGTVQGMIQLFHVIAQSDAMGRPELLAGGISTALLTTAAGLFVAIPAIMAYLFFTSRVDRLMSLMDQHAQELVNHVACDGFRESPARKPAKSSRAA